MERSEQFEVIKSFRDKNYVPPKEEFLNLQAKDIEFTLIKDEKMNDITYYWFQIRIVPFDEYYKISKRHSEFESLHEALCMIFAQLVFVNPPSKLRLLHKIKRRKAFYIDLLSQIKNYMVTYPDYRVLFLKKIYQFFIVDSKLMEEKEIKRDIDVQNDTTLQRERAATIESVEEFTEDLGATVYSKSKDDTYDRSVVYNTLASEGYKDFIEGTVPEYVDKDQSKRRHSECASTSVLAAGPKVRPVQFNKLIGTLGYVYCKESRGKRWLKYYGRITESNLSL